LWNDTPDTENTDGETEAVSGASPWNGGGDQGGFDSPWTVAEVPEAETAESDMDMMLNKISEECLDEPTPDNCEVEELAYISDALGVLAEPEAYEEAEVEPEECAEMDEECDAALDVLQDAEEELLQDVWVDERLGEVPSHELVKIDEDGDPIIERTRMVFVDEVTCIGCTMCASISPSTFLMEDAHGRARVFNQKGDDEETIAEAISTCPVDCIHYVPWEELVQLERQRDQVMGNYSPKGRYVGNEGFLSSKGAGEALLDISTNNMMRCSNCPTNECPECPMFGVSTTARKKQCGSCPENGCSNCPVAAQYPDFQKRRQRRDRKRKELIKARKEEAAEALGVVSGGAMSEL
jgi:ferredoxin